VIDPTTAPAVAWMDWTPDGVSWGIQERRRVCRHSGCYTQLSAYNSTDRCSVHERRAS
jgi:hypothetical protein